MTKYYVGQKVIIDNDAFSIFIGARVSVVEVDDNDDIQPIRVLLPDGKLFWLDTSLFSVVEPEVGLSTEDFIEL